VKLTKPQTWLLVILLTNLISTGIHYWDNYISFDRYPVPTWITLDGVWISWLLLTIVGGLGYWLYCQQKWWLAAYICLTIYVSTGASTPLHYLYAPMSHFMMRMNISIWSDGLAALLLILFLVWSVVIAKEWQLDRQYDI
jgi:hypothetical protein